MKGQKTKGFALMLVSLVLLIGFQSVGWAPVFDLGIQWQHIWMLVGVLGFLLAWTGARD